MSLLEDLMEDAWFDGSSCARAIRAPRDETWLESQGLGTLSCADAWCEELKRIRALGEELRRIKYLPGNAPWRKPKAALPCWDPKHDDTRYWKEK